MITGAVVELVGTPGAGKTTFVPLVCDALADSGLRPRTTVDVARDLAARGRLGALASRLPPRLRNAALWRLYLLNVTTIGWWRVLGDPVLRGIVRMQAKRPAAAMVSERRVVRYFIRHLGTEALFRRRATEGEVLVSDEGSTHRAIQLFVSPSEVPDRSTLVRYLSAVAPATATIEVGADPATCIGRVRDRGVWDRLARAGDDQLVAFIHNAAITIGASVDIRRKAGARVVTLDNSGPTTPSMEIVGRLVDQALVGVVRSAQPAWWLPKLGTLGHRAGRALRGSAVAGAEVSDALRSIGLEAHRIDVLAGGRRSAMVGAHTNEGRVVLKRYADDWPEDSIRHEHEVLGRLEEIGFPAVRLVRSIESGSGAVGGGPTRYALYRYIPGRSYSGMVLPRAASYRLWGELGGLLADLHSALAEFRPDHRHHLGLDPESRLPLRSLDWHRARLDRFRADRASWSGEDGRWLVDRADEIDSQLVAVHDRLRERNLSTTTIHGDFGLHNTLHTVDGPVLHDFELARTEWRLTELAMVHVRLRAMSAREALTEAYFQRSDIDAERSALPTVIDWYLLSSAVYAWDRFSVRQDASRLGVARRRAEQALTGSAGGVGSRS
jgi:Ser/Thr protein kinase RdoA (MazF antagonist)